MEEWLPIWGPAACPVTKPYYGGQPSVMLHNSIRSKAPGGKKEIDVYKLNH